MTSSTSVLKASGKGLSTVDSKSASEVPIFLRKTYHMIDTCDDNVACWSEDGKTFIVKRPTEFEQRIIPQFFKHSKFSSFVRQLNFYGFRKIKFTESIRIDAALEAQTANFWRFRHEKFVQHRPDLLGEIKRSNSTAGPKKKKGAASGGGNATAGSGNGAEDVTVLKSELEVLKTRIAKMTDNIGELTTLVHNVTLQEKDKALNQPSQQLSPSAQSQQPQCQQEAIDESVAVGSKRKKVNVSLSSNTSTTSTSTGTGTGSMSTPAADMNMIVDEVSSSSASVSAMPVPISVPSHTSALEDISFTPDAMFPPSESGSMGAHVHTPLPVTADSEEQAFVDELFNSFGEDMTMTMDADVGAAMEDIGIVPDLACSTPSLTSVSVSPAESPVKQEDAAMLTAAPLPQSQPQHPNAPDQKLMNNLSDALAVLPKDMQELLVNRLIATITSSDALQSHLDSVKVVQVQPEKKEEKSRFGVVHGHGHNHGHGHHEPNAEIALPLAAATLTALMTQFSSAMKDKACVKPKSLPVIPIHA